MPQANEAVAEHMCKRRAADRLPRARESRSDNKLRLFASFARVRSATASTRQAGGYGVFRRCVARRKERPETARAADASVALAGAYRYADECIGHYGLKAKILHALYLLIRRYPDLRRTACRRKALLGEEFTAADEIDVRGSRRPLSTNREQAADNCRTRHRQKLYIASYMQQFIRWEFDAEVSGVQSFRRVVALENGCEGLIRAELMTGDFYQYDEEHMAMVDRHTGKRFDRHADACQLLACKATPPVRSTLQSGRRLASGFGKAGSSAP